LLDGMVRSATELPLSFEGHSTSLSIVEHPSLLHERSVWQWWYGCCGVPHPSAYLFDHHVHSTRSVIALDAWLAHAQYSLVTTAFRHVTVKRLLDSFIFSYESFVDPSALGALDRVPQPSVLFRHIHQTTSHVPHQQTGTIISPSWTVVGR
jgi:hypothetical protein